MIKIKDIISTIEEEAPLHWQEDYDNSGLILGDIEKQCTGVYVCLDLSQEILDNAIENGCNLIISHHPIIYKAIKKIDYSTFVGQLIVRAIKNDIVIYAAHTNMDNAFNGVNGILAEKIGLEKITPLSNGLYHEERNWLGGGAIGTLKKEISKEDFFIHLKNVLGLSVIKHNSNSIDKISRVAICGGSGSFLVSEAIKAKADVFITADIKYHDYLDSEPNILLAEIGHFESEQFIKERIIAIISRKFCNFAPLISDNSTNRIKYF